jgi:hypothetical protein
MTDTLKTIMIVVGGGFAAAVGWALLCLASSAPASQVDLCAVWWGVSILIGLSQVLESFCD